MLVDSDYRLWLAHGDPNAASWLLPEIVPIAYNILEDSPTLQDHVAHDDLYMGGAREPQHASFKLSFSLLSWSSAFFFSRIASQAIHTFSAAFASANKVRLRLRVFLRCMIEFLQE